MSTYLFTKQQVFYFGSDPVTSGQEVTVSYNFTPLNMVNGGTVAAVPQPCLPPKPCPDGPSETLCGCMHESKFHFVGHQTEDIRLITGNRVSIIPVQRLESCHYIGCTCPAWETDNVQWLHNRKYLTQQPDYMGSKNPRIERILG